MVLFGMVVNERRRVDTLLRTVSALRQKKIDALMKEGMKERKFLKVVKCKSFF